MSKAFAWPNGCEGAISLTFDDGRDDQLEKAVPLLDRHGIRATFYTPLGQSDWQTRLERWRGVSESGHEIGNHSVNHPCPGSLFPEWPSSKCLEQMTLVDIEAEILLAEERLNSFFPDRPRTYCYPCYADFVGSGANRQSYVPVVAKHFIAARGKGEFGRNYPATCELHYLNSWRCEGMSGPQMIGWTELAARHGSWDIFTFHSIDHGKLGVRLCDLEELVAHLARAHQRLWVAPVVEVAQYIAAWRSS